MNLPSSVNQPPLIAHIIYALGTGGLENGLINIINRCPQLRYRHVVICLTNADNFANRLTHSEVEVVQLHKKPGHDPAVYWRLWLVLRRLRPAVVHTRNLAALETQILGLLMPRCKRVHGEHGRDVNDLDGSSRKYQWLRKVLSPLIHHYIAVSGDLADWLVDTVKLPARRVTRIYNGVDQTRFISKGTAACGVSQVAICPPKGCPPGFLDNGVRIIGTVGRLAIVKDQRVIVLALARIFDEYPERRQKLHCIIVGDGPERRALEDMILQYDLAESVWLTGDRGDVPALMSCMDVFMLPSLGEGISNTVLEAMATGLPVIATEVGGNPELVEDGVTGLLIPVGDIERLCKAILTLVDTPSLCESMGQAAVKRVRSDFNWDRTVAEYLRVYDQILRHSSQPLLSLGA